MVKILAAGDFHGSYEISNKLAKKAKDNKVDLVVLVGDLHGHREGEGKILDPFIKEKQKVLFIPGNWDSTEEHDRLKNKAKSIHNYYVTYDGVGIAGMGISDMRLKLTENDFDEIRTLFNSMNPKKKILVSHLHAKGTKAEFSGVEGDEFIRKAIDEFQPDIFLAGHIHEVEGIEDKIGNTKIFQVGRKGKILEI